MRIIVIIIIALAILYKTRNRLKEMEGFQSIKEPTKKDDDDNDEDVIGFFGE